MSEAAPRAFCSSLEQRLRALNNLPPLFRMVWESGWPAVLAVLLLRIGLAFSPVAMLFVARIIIDGVVATRERHHSLSPGFWWLVGLEVGLAALGGIMARGIEFYESVLADQWNRYISIKIMKHASQLDLASYEDSTCCDKLERARVQGTDRIWTIRSIGALMQQILGAISLSAAVFLFSPWLLLVLIVAVVPALIGESHFALLGYSLNFRQTATRRRMDYLRVVGAGKEAAKEMRLFALSPFIAERYEQLCSRIYRENVALSKRRMFFGALLSLVNCAGYFGAFGYVIYRTLKGDLSVGTMTFMSGAIIGATGNISVVFSTFSSIADQALFLTDLLDFFNLSPQIKSSSGALPAPRPIRRGFEFHNVCFAYPGNPRLVLDGLNLTIEPGERVALIGENGQGKTTIIKLLTRLYDPTAGCILLDGIDLREYNIEALCREIGVIFQDFMRYQLTAAENIAVGQIEAMHDRPRIECAARKSLAHIAIQQLPCGFDQMLGRSFDDGVDLSVGEWQKVALARAYLRDAQLLILDEPTASLDARAEHGVFQRFTELTDGKMALLISHRFSTVRMANRILVLEDGRIAESGSHDHLVALGGRYSEMFMLQATSYR